MPDVQYHPPIFKEMTMKTIDKFFNTTTTRGALLAGLIGVVGLAGSAFAAEEYVPYSLSPGGSVNITVPAVNDPVLLLCRNDGGDNGVAQASISSAGVDGLFLVGYDYYSGTLKKSTSNASGPKATLYCDQGYVTLTVVNSNTIQIKNNQVEANQAGSVTFFY